MPSHRIASHLMERAVRPPVRLPAVILSGVALVLAVLGCGLSSTQVIKPAVTPIVSDPPQVSTHEVAQTTTLNGGSTGPVVATCPPGELALSGGWSIPSQGARVFAARVTGNSWAVSVLPLGHPATTTVTAYVECLRGATGTTVTQRETTKSFPPSVPSDKVDAAGEFIGVCQQNEGLVGGGFDFGAAGDSLELQSSIPSEYLQVRSWAFNVWNHDAVAHDATFDLMCLTSTAQGAVSYPSQQGTALFSSMSGSATAACPSGTMVAGGGFRYTRIGPRTSYLGNEYLHNATPVGWQSSLYGVSGYGLYAIYPEAIAVCLSLVYGTPVVPTNHP